MRDPHAKPTLLPGESPSILPDRVSGTEFAESVALASGRRVLRLSSIPPGPIDRLYLALAHLPIEEGPYAVIRATIDGLAGLLPGYAVGACYADVPGAPRTVMKSGFQPELPADPGSDAVVRRIFLDHAMERAIDVECDPDALSLHVAGDDAILDDEGPAVVLLKRAGLTLSTALAHARSHAEAQAARAELAELRERMVQADKLATFGQLAAGIIHELNNPLTSILVYTELLLRKRVQQGEGRDEEDVTRLHRIGESANRLLRFTRDLVSYTRPASEARTDLDVHGTIDQAILFCEHEIAQVRANVERRYGARAVVQGFPQQFIQIFVNLVTNACQAMPEGGGRLIVSTELTGDTGAGCSLVKIVLEDSGPGIAPEIVPLVFTPFFTTKDAGRGTGLGLSIVKSLVEAHAGEIRVESGGAPSSVRPPDVTHERGARFIVTLPLATLARPAI